MLHLRHARVSLCGRACHGCTARGLCLRNKTG